MKYSIVIPTYNHCRDLLIPCVESVLKYSHVYDIELIISANGCVDETKEYLKFLKDHYEYLGLYDNLKIAWHDEALGYARSTNVGIKLATTDKILLLNNDVVILWQANKNEWLETLDKPFQTKPNCGVSCTLTQYSEVTKSEFGLFFCAMIHRKVIDKIGLISEDYLTGGHEDTDYCIRAEQAGFTIEQETPLYWSQEANMHIGSFPLYHKGEGTVHDPSLVPGWERIFYKNKLLLAKKYNQEWYEQNKHLADL